MNQIDLFLSQNQGKKVVVVQGLGFVGAVMSLVCANALTEEYAVIGVDLTTDASIKKIDAINNGIFPIKAEDPKIELFYEQARKKNNLLATSDVYAYSKADVIIVDINLDVQKKNSNINELLDYEVDLIPFKKAMSSIGNNCKQDALILVETTVPPGTCQHIVKPLIVSCLSERGLPTNEIKIGHSYERVMPGPKYIDSIQNFYRVFSGIDEKSKRATETFLRTIISTDEYPLTELGNTNATEMAKVLENSYRSINIGFMVEWTRFAEEASVDIYEVVNAIRMRPTHKNIMLPGIGVGGYCLTKDPLLASWSKKNIFKSDEGLTNSENGVRATDLMPFNAYKYLKKIYGKPLNGAKILLLGVSYLHDVGDTRYTPVETFYNCIDSDEAQITLFDPYVSHWDEKNIGVNNDLDKVIRQKYDVIVISTGHTLFKQNETFIAKLKEHNADSLLYDTIGIFTKSEIDNLKTFLNFQVLGRGDLIIS